MKEGGTLGRTNELEKYFDVGSLPEELEKFRHKLEWPIDPNLSGFHLANYFEDRDYISPEFGPHSGIDIQVPAGTEVRSVTNSRLVFFSHTDCFGLAEMEFFNEDGLVIHYLHLNPRRVPRKFSIQYWHENNPKVKQGENIGVVGSWPIFGEPSVVRIPKDVKKIHGTSYHHLHLQFQFIRTKKVDDDYARQVSSSFPLHPVNPLLLLRYF